MMMNICLLSSFGTQEHEEHEDDDELGSLSSFAIEQHEEDDNEHLLVIVFKNIITQTKGRWQGASSLLSFVVEQ